MDPKVINDENEVEGQLYYKERIRRVQFTYKWIVDNFYYSWNYVGPVGSEKFSLPGNLGTGVLSLQSEPDSTRLQDNHEDASQTTPVSAKLIVHLQNLVSQHIDIDAFALNSMNQRTALAPAFLVDIGREKAVLQVSPFITSTQLANWNAAHVDTVTIVCNFTIHMNTYAPLDDYDFQPPSRDNDIGSDLQMYFGESKYSDVIVKVGKQKIPAHRVILSARSCVFARLLDRMKKEIDNNTINIVAVPEDVGIEMLKFIYTGVSPNMETMMGSLLVAAEEYEIKSLRVVCAQNLHKGINIDNAIDRLVLAQNYKAGGAKEHILTFIDTHKNLLVRTEQYKILEKVYPQLALVAFQLKRLGPI
ncbi:protein roadkill-like [Diachasmimorpha longicaudata]|uniref:protein roadkill-like n=1 Tax=Diachasmimorpha longicaudata TaxID=58733 RepID=UPI0030B88E53